MRVDCQTASVTLENLVIENSATVTGSTVNAVEVSEGSSLRLFGCTVDTRTYNCVKLRSGAMLIAKDSTFVAKNQYAVSAVNHSRFEVQDCKFEDDGVEALAASGTIKGCDFFGDMGVAVAMPESKIEVSESNFKAGKHAITARQGGKVTSTNNVIDTFEVGVFVVANPNSQEGSQPGEISLSKTQTVSYTHLTLPTKA